MGRGAGYEDRQRVLGEPEEISADRTRHSRPIFSTKIEARRKGDRSGCPHECADQCLEVDSSKEHMALADCAGEVRSLCGDPPSIDCWLWISGARPCEMAQGTRRVRNDPSRHRRSCSTID